LISGGIGVLIAFFGLAAEGAAIVVLTVILFRYRRHWLSWRPDWRELRRHAPQILGLGALFGVGAVALLHLNPPPMRFIRFAEPPLAASVLLIASLALVSAFLEEWLWRLLVYVAVLQAGLPATAGMVLQAIGFGIAHRRGLPGGPVGMIGAGAFGLAQGLLRLRGRSLWELVCIHAFVDGIIFTAVWHSWTLFGGARFGP
jgi:hypothetical protein